MILNQLSPESRKTVDASVEDLARLETGIRDMSKEIPASAVEIAGVAEAAGQLGIEVPNIMEFTRVMIDPWVRRLIYQLMKQRHLWRDLRTLPG